MLPCRVARIVMKLLYAVVVLLLLFFSSFIVPNMTKYTHAPKASLLLLVGVHEFNFYLDGEWKCDQKLPWSKDHNGCPRNLINVRQVLLLLLFLLMLFLLFLLIMIMLLLLPLGSQCLSSQPHQRPPGQMKMCYLT